MKRIGQLLLRLRQLSCLFGELPQSLLLFLPRGIEQLGMLAEQLGQFIGELFRIGGQLLATFFGW